MNAEEILDELKRGEVVTIRAADAFEFMRETERHSISPQAIKMEFVGNACVMRSDRVDQPREDQ